MGSKEEQEGIRREEVEEVIKEMKEKKAAGTDGLLNEVWIYGGERLKEKIWEPTQHTVSWGYPKLSQISKYDPTDIPAGSARDIPIGYREISYYNLTISKYSVISVV